MSLETFGVGALAFLGGYAFRGDVEEWFAARRYRCEVCGSRTNDDGVGAREALDDGLDVEEVRRHLRSAMRCLGNRNRGGAELALQSAHVEAGGECLRDLYPEGAIDDEAHAKLCDCGRGDEPPTAEGESS